MDGTGPGSHSLIAMGFPFSGILCKHLIDRDGLTLYLISERPPTGICSQCFATYGRMIEAVPKENLEIVPEVFFQRRKEKCFPVYKRLLERIGNEP